MEHTPLLDRAGRHRSPATTSSFHKRLSRRNDGLWYAPDPPTVEEIVAVMRAAGDSPDRTRLRGIFVVVIQRQLGHADLAITSRYLRGIDNTEIIAAVHQRPAPMIPADPRIPTPR